MHESTRNKPFWFNVLHGRLSHFSGFIRITHIFLYKTHWNLYLLPLNVLEFLQAKSETALYKKIKDTKKQRTMPSTQAYKWVCLGRPTKLLISSVAQKGEFQQPDITCPSWSCCPITDQHRKEMHLKLITFIIVNTTISQS